MKTTVMEAIISELWETGIDIITTEDEFEGITDLSDLRKCNNVLIGEKCCHGQATEVLIDNSIVEVSFRLVSHPTGCGKLRICEIS